MGSKPKTCTSNSPDKANKSSGERRHAGGDRFPSSSQRVELNAFASDEFIQWLELKLAHHGIAKVVPGGDTIADAYRRMRKQALVQARIYEVLDALEDEQAEPPPIPDDLTERLKELMGRDPAQSWDACFARSPRRIRSSAMSRGTRAGSITAPRAADARASDLGPIPRPRRRAVSADLSTFLERFRPDGCTCFVGIVPDGTTVAESFNGAEFKRSRDVDQEPEPGTQLLLYGEPDAARSAQEAGKEGCY